MSLAENILGGGGEIARRITKIGDHEEGARLFHSTFSPIISLPLDLGVRLVDAEQEQVVAAERRVFSGCFSWEPNSRSSDYSGK